MYIALIELVEPIHYYSFGAQMPGRGFTSSTGYRYGFNGQEKDDEVSGAGNSNTAEFWQYDTRLGRRWNIDPINMVWLSSYSTFDNNPILYNDILGNTFDKASGSDKIANEQTVQLDVRDKELDKLISYKKSEVDQRIAELKGGPKTQAVKNLEGQLSNLRECKAQVVAAKKEIKDMEGSPQLFILEPSNREGGETYYKGGAVHLSYDKTKWEVLGQELKHGHQFLQGKISFDAKKGQGGVLFDKTDEVEGYKRQFALEPDRTIKSFADNKPAIKISNIFDIRIREISALKIYDALGPLPKDLDNTKSIGTDIVIPASQRIK